MRVNLFVLFLSHVFTVCQELSIQSGITVKQGCQVSQYESLCVGSVQPGITVWIQHCHSVRYVICYGLYVILAQGRLL